MKEKHIVTLINLGFILFFFIFPFIFCLYFIEHTALTIIVCFLIAAFLIVDWYHLHLTDSVKDCFKYLLFSIGIILVSSIILYIVFDTVFWNFNPTDVSKSEITRYLFQVLIGSFGILAACIISIPRLMILKILNINIKNV